MSKPHDTSLESLVYVDDTNGVTVIPQLSELRRLNWFDGKLLRADDLRVEQDHVRALVRRSTRAGGHGAVQGMTCTLGADGLLHVGPGMAIDPGGRSLLLPVDVPLDVQQLIDRTAAVAAAAPVATNGKGGFAECVGQAIESQAPVGGGRWYAITVAWTDGLCGTEDVYGRLCEDACTTSTGRPWRIDGLVFRARPIQPATPLAASTAVALGPLHERSLLASALFADERAAAGSLIFGAGLRSPIWCMGAAPTDPVYDEVPLAVIGRRGGVTTFLDVWTARRERIEPPPQRYWAGRMSMRPWDVFLAQVLQFQCQLSDLVVDGLTPGAPDPCADHRQVLEKAIAELEKRPPQHEPGKSAQADEVLDLLKKQMLSLGLASGTGASSPALVAGGIVELPPAGYLPVEPAGPVEDQVRALLGRGVDLTFCTTRQDAVARAFEEAQHLDRISLLRGLDDPKRPEEVEIIVPDAELQEEVAAHEGWKGRMEMPSVHGFGATMERINVVSAIESFRRLDGAGRIDVRDGLVLKWAGAESIISEWDELGAGPAGVAGSFVAEAEEIVSRWDELGAGPAAFAGSFGEAAVSSDPFSLDKGKTVAFGASLELVFGPMPGQTRRCTLSGTLQIDSITGQSPRVVLKGTIIHGSAQLRVASDGKDDKTLTLDKLAVTLTRSTVAGGAKVRLTSPEIPDFPAEVLWRDANTVQITVLARGLPSEALFAEGPGAQQAQEGPAGAQWHSYATLKLQRDPDAASPGNPARTVAESALSALEEALDIPGYAEDAAQRLFPAADESGQRLRATRDWVLFRRRAILRCGTVAPVPVPVPVPVKTESCAVYGSTDPRWRFPTFLGLLRFRAGSDELLEGAGDVAGAWDDVAHGGTMDGVAIIAGSPGPQDLWLERTAQLVKALAGVTPTPGLPTQIVNSGPLANLDPQDADGVMVVRAKKPPAEVEVAVVAVDPKSISAVRDASTPKGRIAAIFEVPHVLGIVRFPVDSAIAPQPDLQAVEQAYDAVPGELPIGGVTVFSTTDDPSPDKTDLRLERALSISKIGKANVMPSITKVTEADLEAARSHVKQNTIVVLTPTPPVMARVIVVKRPNIYLGHMSPTIDVAAGVKEALSGPTNLGSVRFEPASATADPAQLKGVGQNWKKLGRSLDRVDIVVREADATSEALDTARGKVIQAKLTDEAEEMRRFKASSFPNVTERMLIIVVPHPPPD